MFTQFKKEVEVQLERMAFIEAEMMGIELHGGGTETPAYVAKEEKWNEIRSELLNLKEFIDANVGEFM